MQVDVFRTRSARLQKNGTSDLRNARQGFLISRMLDLVHTRQLAGCIFLVDIFDQDMDQAFHRL